MKITELFAPDAAPLTASRTDTDGDAPLTNPDIAGVTADSRQVQPGFLFVALRGVATDGRRFAGEAVAKGAAAILTDDPAALALEETARQRIAIITDPNPQRRLALISSRIYPQRPGTIVAVTGTNGKTSTAHFTREIWEAL
ncbi:MAG TPA: Mur ligase domain-containing protein, partial [Stellaceae bacterium]|nr:Mur ligase domain-containing protein [Stellaceae bacterium]